MTPPAFGHFPTSWEGKNHWAPKGALLFTSLGTVPLLAVGFEGRWRLSKSCGWRRDIEMLPPQEIFHRRDRLRIVAFLAIDAGADSSLIPSAIGILATTCTIAIVV
jgi:hypothetical protein